MSEKYINDVCTMAWLREESVQNEQNANVE